MREQTHQPPKRRMRTPDALRVAARRLFARRGYDGTSVRAITSAADANLGAVTYHFGGKRALYDVVVAEAVEPLAARVASAAGGPGSVLDRAEAVVAAFFAHLREHPDLPFLMLQELAAGRDPPEPAARVLGRIAYTLQTLIREGQASGEVRSGDPVLMALSVVAQPLHLTLAQRVVRLIAEIDIDDPSERPRLVEHASRFVRAGLAASEPESGQ